MKAPRAPRAPRTRGTKKAGPAAPIPVPWSSDHDDILTQFIHFITHCNAGDTETTGLTELDEVAELAAARIFDGSPVFHSYVHPTVPFHPEVTDPGGRIKFNPANCINAPSWAEIEPAFLAAHSGPLICWSADPPDQEPFDRRLMDQSRQGVYMRPFIPGEMKVVNIKWMYNTLKGKGHGANSLTAAIRNEGLQFRGAPHTAMADTLAVVDLIHVVVEAHLYTPEGARNTARNIELSRIYDAEDASYPLWNARAVVLARNGFPEEGAAARAYANEIAVRHDLNVGDVVFELPSKGER